jgi:hypothetical protein
VALAFFPPDGYVRRIRRSGGGSAPPGASRAGHSERTALCPASTPGPAALARGL